MVVLKVQNTGNTKHHLYRTWLGINNRTSNPDTPDYANYGGRGIKVCDRWQGLYGFRNFIEDMGERPPNHTLDRKDNNGDYSPDNCRWATHHQQAANQRTNNKTVGVYWIKKRNKWLAEIMVEGKKYNLGSFTEYEDAVAARKAAEVQYNVIV